MPTHYQDPVITCDGCGLTTNRPAGRSYQEGWAALAEKGWRSRANPDERPLRLAPHTFVWSCPGCPSVS